MPTTSTVNIPPPASWDELEIIVWDLFRHIWKDPYAARNGRIGQRQHGVDVYGCPNMGTERHGVQVKGKNANYGSHVTESELREEVEKAKEFEPHLAHFTLVTSASRDAEIQRVARQITEEHQSESLFPVDVWGWEDVQERLPEFPGLLELYYSHFFAGSDGVDRLVQELIESRDAQARIEEERDRPRFEITGASVTTSEEGFEPGFRIQRCSGDSVRAIEWRFRGPYFSMEWRQLSVSHFERTTLANRFDLSLPPGADNLIAEDQLGMEIRFHWRGQWRHEIHMWPITRRVLNGVRHCDLGREIIPSRECDSDTGQL